MATLREVRRRIAGVKTTQKITRAMKMVAAAKLRRAQSSVVSARPYARKIRELLEHLVSNVGLESGSLFVVRPMSRAALVVVTSDRGMCGAFNSNVIKTVERRIAENAGQDPGRRNVTLFCVGKKGADYFGKRQFDLSGKYIGVYNALVFAQAKRIVKDIVEGYLQGKFDRVDVIYNEFKSVAQQRIITEQFLPIPAEAAVAGEGTRHSRTDYIYEPSSAAILQALVPKHLDFQLWRVLLESNAAEQGARMAAMENATENAEELISTLQLQYNKARQASITRELLEIVSGAEALMKAG